MYILHHPKHEKLDVCQAPRYVKAAWINKIKNINYLNKDKPKKKIAVLKLTEENKNISGT